MLITSGAIFSRVKVENHEKGAKKVEIDLRKVIFVLIEFLDLVDNWM